MMKKLSLTSWVLILSIGALFLLFWLLPARDYSATEKRYLANPPTVTWESLLSGDVSRDVEDYLTDHFPGRNLFVGVHAYWNLFTGRNAVGSVYHCGDGYLIRAPEQGSLDTLDKNVTRFAAFAQGTGLPASLIVVPSAGSILEDLLPANHDAYPDDEAMEHVYNLAGDLAVLDLREEFAQEKTATQLYYKTDHHLTSAGCYTVYNAYCRSLGLAPLPKAAYTILRSTGFKGTGWSSSGYWLTKADDLELWQSGDDLTVTIVEAGQEDVVSDSPFFLDNLSADDQYTVFLDGNHTLVRIDNPGTSTGERLLVLRDSFGHCIAPFLASNYSQIILVDLRYYRASVSQLIQDYGITRLLFLYGMDSLLTDTNSAWLS